MNNDDYPKIINQNHYERLLGLIKTEDNIIGGRSNNQTLKIESTLMPDADFDHEIMQDEIFGPLFPIIEYDDLNTVLHIIKQREKSLACYIFSQNNADKILKSLSFGGGCVNDVVLHVTNHHLPFGGVENSGMGHYHGKYGFDTFSHQKGIVKNSTLIDVPLRYAPFDDKKFKLLKRIM